MSYAWRSLLSAIVFASLPLGGAGQNEPLKINMFDYNLLDGRLPFSDPMLTFNWFKYDYDKDINIKPDLISLAGKADGSATKLIYRNDNFLPYHYGADCFGPMTYKLSLETKLSKGGEGRIVVGQRNNLTFDVPPSDEWEKHSWDFYSPGWESLTFEAKGKNSLLQLRNLCLTPKYESKIKNKISVASDGKETVCPGIYLKGDYASNHDPELVAAMTINRHLALATGETLTVFKSDGKTTVPGGIYLGRAALDRGLISGAQISAVGKGGFVIECKNGAAAIAGKDSEGLISGALCFLERAKTASPQQGTVRRDRVTIPEMSLTKTPEFECFGLDARAAMNYGISGSAIYSKQWGSSNRLGGFCGWEHNAAWFVNYKQYGESHPEYFAADNNGKRITTGDPFRMHICMSNNDTLPIFTGAADDLMRLQPEAKYFNLAQGDSLMWCRCEKCKGKAPSDLYFPYLDKVAAALEKSHPDRVITGHAYFATIPPPAQKIKSGNIRIFYCLAPKNVSALSAEENRKTLDYLKSWTEQYPGQIYLYLYPAANSYKTYNTLQFFIDTLREFKKQGGSGVYFNGNPQFFGALFAQIMNEMSWDLNIDTGKATDEFMAGYYGAAAPQMRKIFDIYNNHVKEKGLKAKKDDTMYGEDCFKNIYGLFDGAEKAVAGDERLRARIEKEKFCFLFTDLAGSNIGNGKISTENMPEYAAKLAELAGLIKKNGIVYLEWMPEARWQEWFFRTAGLDFTDFNDPRFGEFLKDPLSSLKNRPSGQRKLDNGWFIPAKYLLGGDQTTAEREKYNVRVIRRPLSGQHALKTSLMLDKAPEGNAFLEIMAREHEKDGHPDFKIVVNGKNIFEGPSAFPKDRQTWLKFEIGKDVLRTGENIIEIINTTPEQPGIPEKDPFYQNKMLAEELPNVDLPSVPAFYWGWIMISGAKVTFGK